jgi:hypothetical protein
MRDAGDRFIEALAIQERLWARGRSRTIGKWKSCHRLEWMRSFWDRVVGCDRTDV